MGYHVNIKTHHINTLHQGDANVHEEKLVVSLTDAGAEVRAMVVMNRNTAITNTTMKHPWSLNNMASWTLLAHDLVFCFIVSLLFFQGELSLWLASVWLKIAILSLVLFCYGVG